MRLTLSALLCTCAVVSAALDAQNPFEVFPTNVNLKSQRDRQSLVVRITEANGVHRDVTAEAKFSVADPAKAKVENGVVAPLADGETNVKVEWNGKTAEVPVKVEAAATDRPVSFRLDVMPVFMKAELQLGSCHGAARGQGRLPALALGFRSGRRPLSADARARRAPDQSGDARGVDAHHQDHRRRRRTPAARLFEKDSELAKTLIRWLEAGAPNDDTSEVAHAARASRSFPKSAAARKPRPEVQDHGARALFRRHRSRRDQSRAFPDEQRSRSAKIDRTA